MPGLSLNTRFTRGDGLHEAVALHRLVGIHRVQEGRDETGQPHVAHDHDFERVLRVLETGRQFASLGLVADVLLPFGAVFGATGNHDFQRLHLPLGGLLNG